MLTEPLVVSHEAQRPTSNPACCRSGGSGTFAFVAMFLSFSGRFLFLFLYQEETPQISFFDFLLSLILEHFEASNFL